MRYCSGKEIKPADVTDAALDAYMAYRGTTTCLATGVADRRLIARTWNAYVGSVTDWPRQRLTEPPLNQPSGPTWSDFPEGLRRDIESYLEGMTKTRRGLRGKRIRPCKPSTIRTRREELIAVVKRAKIVPLEELTSLRALLNPSVVEAVLDAFWQKDGERPGIFTIDLGWKLLSIAREIGMEAADLEQLDNIRAELESYRQAGLTVKNQSLIRQVLN